jgi:hypothetical protein
MSRYTKTVPKNPADINATLTAVLDLIIFQTKDGDKLVGYQNQSDAAVVLTFEGD